MKNWNISQYLKSGRTLKIFSIAIIITLLIATSCNNDDDDSISGPEKPACTITKETATTTGKEGALTYTLVYSISHSYDAAGNPIARSQTYNYTYSDGTRAQSTNSANMQYDSKGFLLRTLRQYATTDRTGKATSSTQNEDYTYENERLIKNVIQWIDNGTDRSYVTTYEYNDAGKIIKYQNTYNNSTTSIQWNGDVVTKITYTDAAGNTSSPFIQYDNEGRVVKAIETYNGTTDEFRYEYNSEGLITREERYYDGKPNSGNIYEYDTKQNPNSFVYAKNKGFPTIPSTRPEYYYKHNYSKITNLTVNEAKTALVTNFTTIYIYEYNAKGLPSTASYKSVDSKGVEVSSTTVKYEYSDCQ